MNGRFKKVSAIFATAGLVVGGLAAGLVATASSAGATTAQTACEAGGCTVGGEAASTANPTVNEALGVQFTLSDGGTINSVCYPFAADMANYPSEAGTDTITVTQVGGGFTESGVATGGCVNFPHTNQSAGTTFVASYVDPFGHVNDGGAEPAGTVGDVTGIQPTVNGPNTNPGVGFGVSVVIFSDPLAPSPVSVAPTTSTTATFHFEGDGIASGTTPFVCSATSGTVTPASGTGTSGVNNVLLTGLTPSASNVITCTVHEVFGSSIGPSASASTHLAPPAPTNILVTPAGPTAVNVAVTGDGAVGATFTATCTSSAGGPSRVATGTSSAILVGGFSNVAGQTITCSVTETSPAFPLPSLPSILGSTAIAGASGPGCIPAGTVAAPTQISAASQAFPGAEVSWAPVNTDCLVGYLVTPTTGSAVLVPGHGTTTLMKGPFAFGSIVGFTVAAVTGAGVGPQSTGVSVTIGTPAAATNVKATKAGKGSIKVSFKAGNNNGASIKSFTAKCGSKSASGKSSPLTVKGLTAGKKYTCTVTAANSRGTGAAARSGAVKA